MSLLVAIRQVLPWISGTMQVLHACDATSSCQELTRAVATFARHARNLMRHHVCSKMLSDCPVLWCTVQIGAVPDWPTLDRMPTAGFFRNQRCGYAANHSQADFFGNCNAKLSDCPVINGAQYAIGTVSDWPTLTRMPTAGFFWNQRCGHAANHRQADVLWSQLELTVPTPGAAARGEVTVLI